MRALAIAASGALVLCGCDDSAQRNAREPEPQTEPVRTERAARSAEKAPTSIMRPSVAAEVEAQPPQLEPSRASVFFERGGMALSDEARAVLDQLLKEEVTGAGGAIFIRGHSDSRGHDGDNLVASEKRAEAVADYLREKGIDEQRMTVIALGEGRPIAPNVNLDGSDNEEGRAKNRRVEIEVLPPPQPAEGSKAQKSAVPAET